MSGSFHLSIASVRVKCQSSGNQWWESCSYRSLWTPVFRRNERQMS